MELMDINDDCLEYLLKFCDADSLVVVSQTCKKLQTLATPSFKYKISYNCDIYTKDDETRVKRTIGAIGNFLTQLNFRTNHHWELNNVFIACLPRKCPNLQKLEIRSRVSPNVIFGGVDALQKLEHLTIRCLDEDSGDVESAMRLARELKQLRSLKVFGVEWNHRAVIDFIREAKNLNYFGFDIDYPKRRSHYEISNVFLEEFKSLCISDPCELIFFVDFRELVLATGDSMNEE